MNLPGYQNESWRVLLSYTDDLYDVLTRNIPMIVTQFSLRAYREVHPAGARISLRGWLALRGTIGKEIAHGN